MTNIVVINGGRGAKSFIQPLVSNKKIKVTSIVNAFDDGKSTGIIRNFFNILGPSDLRKVQQLMLNKKDRYYKEYNNLFDYRISNKNNQFIVNEISQFVLGKKTTLFNIRLNDRKLIKKIKIYFKSFLYHLDKYEKKIDRKFDFNDCSLFNCIYAGAYKYYNNNFEKTVSIIGKDFKLNGEVLCANNTNLYLSAVTNNNKFLESESIIVEKRSNTKIKEIFFTKKPLKSIFFNNNINSFTKIIKKHSVQYRTSKRVINSLKKANIIIYAPGTQHSSLYPTYKGVGFSKCILSNKQALKILITNIGADYETPRYKASDYVLCAYRYLDNNKKIELKKYFNYIFINNNSKKNNKYVDCDFNNLYKLDVKFVIDDFEDKSKGLHNGFKVLNKIFSLYSKK